MFLPEHKCAAAFLVALQALFDCMTLSRAGLCTLQQLYLWQD